MEIIVAFTKPNPCKIGSKFISFFINRPYSHVLVYWYSKSLDRHLVYHAAKGKVHFIELNNFLKENVIVKEHRITITQDQHTSLVKKCIDLAGQKYSLSDLIVNGLYEISQKLRLKIKFKNHKGYICSELLAELLQDIYDKPFLKNCNLVNPADIDEFLEKHNT